MHALKRFFYWVIGLLLLGALAGVAIAAFFEDEVKQYVVHEINKKVKTEIAVSNVSFSVLEKFPYASVAFSDVQADENIVKMGELDTLFYFEKVYLQFNIIDLFNGNYRIRKISLENGFFNMSIDADGYDNFHFWKSSGDSTSAFFLELEKVVVDNVNYSYKNDYRKQNIAVAIEDMVFRGAFSRQQYDMNIEGDFLVHQFLLGKNDYVKNRKFDLSTVLQIDSKKERYTFREGVFRVDNALNFALNGAFEENSLDLEIVGRDLDIVSTKALLPADIRKLLDDYKSEGILDFKAKLIGAFGRTSAPAVDATFSITNGTITHRKTGHSLTNVNLSGSCTNGKGKSLATTVIHIDEFDSFLNDGKVKSTLTVTNLNQPIIDAELLVNLDLAKLHQFINTDTFDILKGNLEADISYKGQWKNPKKLTRADFKRAKGEGKITLTGATVKMQGHPQTFENVAGSFLLHNNDLLIKELTGKVEASDFQLQGLFRNMLAWVFLENENLTIETEFRSQFLDLQTLLNSGDTESKSSRGLHFPEEIHFNLKLAVDSLVYQKFAASNVTGVVTCANGQLTTQKIRFNTMDGSITGQLQLQELANSQFRLAIRSDLDQLNIRELFYQFDNFGQNFLQADHLLGKASARVRFESTMNNELIIDPASIDASASIVIDDGELIAFAPLKTVADNMRENKMVKLLVKVDEFEQKLKHVKFSQLTNQIEIKNQVITIPQMAINSSAMNIDVTGTHDFDSRIDYHLNFRLDQLLSRGKDPEAGQELIRKDPEGGLRLYLRMTGTTDEPIIAWERLNVKDAIKQGVKQEFKAEKKEVKSLLKEELGLFKNDTSVKAAPDKPEPIEFMIEWEEYSTLNTPPKKEATSKKEPPKKGWKKLLKKLEDGEDKKDFENFELEDKDDDF